MKGFFYIKILKLLRLVIKKIKAPEILVNEVNVLIQNKIKLSLKTKLTGEECSKETIQLHPGGNYVWVSWLQGEKYAPFIISECISSIKRYSPNDYEVIVIDESNYSGYVIIPEHILDKYSSGIITKTHFSDILRWALLSEYGGIWMDSTIFLSKNIDFIGKEDFFTLKQSSEESSAYIPKGRWSGFFIKVKPNYQPSKDIYNLLVEYWNKNKELIDYFLIDYVLDLVYERSTEFRDDIKKLDIYGDDIYNLVESSNLDSSLNISDEDVGIYKLSYKTSPSEGEKLEGIIKGLKCKKEINL